MSRQKYTFWIPDPLTSNFMISDALVTHSVYTQTKSIQWALWDMFDGWPFLRGIVSKTIGLSPGYCMSIVPQSQYLDPFNVQCPDTVRAMLPLGYNVFEHCSLGARNNGTLSVPNVQSGDLGLFWICR